MSQVTDLPFYHVILASEDIFDRLFGAIALSYPPFLLMILVQDFMLINNHIETWV